MGEDRDGIGQRHHGARSPPLFPFLLSSCPLPNPPLWVLLLFSSPEDRISPRMKRSLVLEEKANGWADLEQEIGRAGGRG